MHGKEVSHAMSGSVQVAHSLFPQVYAGKGIELRAASSDGELRTSQRKVPLQHKRVIMYFIGCGIAKRNGARNVGRSVEILCSAVNQQQTIGGKRRCALLVGSVMHYCSMFLISGNHAETVASVQFAAAAEFHPLFPYVNFVILACSRILLKPHKQPHQCCAVSLHGLTCTGELHFIFHSLQHGNRRWRIHLHAIKRPGKRVAHLDGIEHDGFMYAHSCKVILNAVVWFDLHVHAFQVSAHIFVKFYFVDKEHLFFVRKIQVRHKHRRESHVAAAQVKRPCNFVERRYENGIGTHSLDFGKHTADFARRAFSGIFFFMYENLPRRAFRTTFGPHAVGYVEV